MVLGTGARASEGGVKGVQVLIEEQVQVSERTEQGLVALLE